MLCLSLLLYVPQLTMCAYPDLSFSISRVCDVLLGEDLMRTRLHLTVLKRQRKKKLNSGRKEAGSVRALKLNEICKVAKLRKWK